MSGLAQAASAPQAAGQISPSSRALAPIAAREGLKLLCDTAQGFGGLLDGKRAGAIGDAAATSFFPAKPLGCYGDGGACFTNDDALRDVLLSLRMHGQGADRYEHVRIGYNSRLDTIQAAILIEKLKIFDDEINLRNLVAKRYNDAFAGSNHLVAPKVIDGAVSTWAQYTLQVERFSRYLRGEAVPRWPIEDSLLTLTIIEALFESAKSSRWQNIGG